ncbi:hypothetical protein JVU11DRAFT_3808 [Chiua virens]|nr:hypothetical protein JVU11DRAFT_3808 [Chiua virens]
MALTSPSQLLEFFVVLCTADHFRYGIAKVAAAFSFAESKSGPVRPDSLPTRLSALVIPLQGFTYVIFPAIYIFTVLQARLQQPSWMNVLALPDQGYHWQKNIIRVFASVVSVALQRLTDDVIEHLGDQFHSIGVSTPTVHLALACLIEVHQRREKQKVIQTGPYAYVRHPLYALVLVQEFLWSLMFWSYAPLIALIVTVAIFAIKIPIEEEAIKRDETMREEYHAYMKKVPARLTPHIW